MKGLGVVERLIELVLASAYVKGERPVSLIIVAPAGSGKSEVMEQYRGYPRTLFCSHISFSALLHEYGPQLRAGRINHIMMSDFATMSSRRRENAAADIAGFSVLIEEGVIRWATRRTVFSVATPRKVGMVLGMTMEDMRRVRAVGHEGFLGRFLRCSFGYSDKLRGEIQDYLAGRKYGSGGVRRFRQPDERAIEADEAYFKLLASHEIGGRTMVEQVREPEADSYGFRAQRQLQTLLMASALLGGRARVDQSDWQTIASIVPLLDRSHYAQLKAASEE